MELSLRSLLSWLKYLLLYPSTTFVAPCFRIYKYLTKNRYKWAHNVKFEMMVENRRTTALLRNRISRLCDIHSTLGSELFDRSHSGWFLIQVHDYWPNNASGSFLFTLLSYGGICTCVILFSNWYWISILWIALKWILCFDWNILYSKVLGWHKWLILTFSCIF